MRHILAQSRHALAVALHTLSSLSLSHSLAQVSQALAHASHSLAVLAPLGCSLQHRPALAHGSMQSAAATRHLAYPFLPAASWRAQCLTHLTHWAMHSEHDLS